MEAKVTDPRLWREICRIWPEFYKHISWEIGSGDRVRLWLDNWFRELRVFGMMLKVLEINVHAIRDCPKIAAIWRAFLNPSDRALFFNLSTMDWIGSSRKAGCGGIIRDNYGNWIKGFVSNLGYASVLSAEIWGIYHGLVTAWNLGFRKVELESDSSQAIKIIQMLREAGSNLRPLQHRISCLLASDWEVKATHIPRNANGCADTIAKHSLASSIGFNMLDNHPSVVVSVMMRDANNSIIHDLGG
ncbi:RnaseH [Senna tora]|uniref:RnaseH (Mitochondrion) n=1 Tax=Senna tora TaxID=362788 RepID=A0A834W3E5_9FABA|nr:RnaseH [Senna tora]